MKERKKEKGNKKDFPEGRGNKRKMQACLNSQVIRKVKKVKKQNKQKKVIYNESTLTKT